MVLQRLNPMNPFTEIRRMDVMLDRLRRGQPHAAPAIAQRENWAAPLDVRQHEDRVTIKASLPGVAPSDVSATIEDGALTIRGKSSEDAEGADGRYSMRERRSGEFSRAIRLPDTLDAERADAVYENGVLTITLPKHESQKPKPLSINVKS